MPIKRLDTQTHPYNNGFVRESLSRDKPHKHIFNTAKYIIREAVEAVNTEIYVNDLVREDRWMIRWVGNTSDIKRNAAQTVDTAI